MRMRTVVVMIIGHHLFVCFLFGGCFFFFSFFVFVVLFFVFLFVVLGLKLPLLVAQDLGDVERLGTGQTEGLLLDVLGRDEELWHKTVTSDRILAIERPFSV